MAASISCIAHVENVAPCELIFPAQVAFVNGLVLEVVSGNHKEQVPGSQICEIENRRYRRPGLEIDQRTWPAVENLVRRGRIESQRVITAETLQRVEDAGA